MAAWRLVVLILAALSPLVSGKASASSDLQRALMPLIHYFESQQLIPIIIPRGQQLGNVYDLKSKRFLYTQQDCFPNLQYKTTPSRLPEFAANSNDGGFLSLGVPMVAEVTLNANTERVVSIGFEEVEVQLAAEAEFRRRYKPEACPEIVAMLQGGLSAWFQRTVVVINELYFGRRIVNLELSDKVDVAARTRKLASALTARGVPVEVTVGTAQRGKAQVSIKSATKIPLGFRPAFIPYPETGTSMGASSPDRAEDKKIFWEPYERNPSFHKATLESLNDEILRSVSEGSLP